MISNTDNIKTTNEYKSKNKVDITYYLKEKYKILAMIV